jgi:hypothetical protein
MHNKYYTSIILKRHSRGILLQAKGDCSDRVHSNQMGLRTVRWDLDLKRGGQKRSKLSLLKGVGPTGLSPLRSDGSCDGKAEGWTSLEEGERENNSMKPRDLSDNRHRNSR